MCVCAIVWMSVFELYKEMKMVTGCSDKIKLLFNEKLETMRFFLSKKMSKTSSSRNPNKHGAKRAWAIIGNPLVLFDIGSSFRILFLW